MAPSDKARGGWSVGHIARVAGWPFLVLVILAGLAGRLVDGLLLLLLILSHEAAHLAVAAGLGCRIGSMRVTPLGGVLQIGPELELIPSFEAMVAAAGPLHHLALLFLAAQAPPFIRALGPHWPFFVRANLSLALFNLLPVHPLDGGRLLWAALAVRVGSTRATAVVGALGRAIRPIMLVLGIVALLRGQGPLLAFCGLYLVWARPRRHGPVLPDVLLLTGRKRTRLAHEEMLPVRWLVVTEEAGIWASLCRAGSHHYVVFCVLGGTGGLSALVTEEEALTALVQLGLAVKFSGAIAPVNGRGGVSAPPSNGMHGRHGGGCWIRG